MRTILNDTFKEQLTAAGYNKYSASHEDRHDGLWQRRVMDGTVTLYFIQVRFWDFSVSPTDGRVAYDVYVNFFNAAGHFRIEFDVSDTDTVASIEARVAEFYKNNNCTPDEHNN